MRQLSSQITIYKNKVLCMIIFLTHSVAIMQLNVTVRQVRGELAITFILALINHMFHKKMPLSSQE